MTEERPDDARETDPTGGPDSGVDGQEARPAPASDARFTGLRSAADIFGAPRTADEWPSRRERREAERAAAETGQPLPEPFEPQTPSAPDEPEARDERQTPEAPAAPQQPSTPAPPADDATQAISMPEELARPSQPAQPASDPDRSLLSSRIPAAAPVAPNTTAPHPSAIELPSAMAHRAQRAAETRAIEDERRRTDPHGEGRDDVDWLGRATGSSLPPAGLGDVPAPTGPVAQPLGVPNALPTSDEPPSFTDLLRIPDAGLSDRPFDWAVHDDATGEVPTALTSASFDTTTLGAGSWSLTADQDDDEDVVSGEIPVPAAAPVVPVAPTAPVAPTTPVPPTATTPPTDPVRRDAPSDSGSWSLADDAVRTGETPWWAADDAARTATEPDPGAPARDEPTGQAPVPPLVEPTRAPVGLPPAAPQAPEDLDQSEWHGRETSDTSAIKDLFGTEAVDQLGATGYDPHDTGTRMMPAAVAPTPARPQPASPTATGARSTPAPPAADIGNFINHGFARLRGEGKRGKQLLIGGAIVIIIVMLVAVFALTRWIIGNNLDEQLTPTKSPAAASASVQTSTTPEPQAAATPASAPTITFATTAASPGQHPWYELAGGECMTPFTDPWSEDFTVVDCATAHAAQLTRRGAIEADAFPGADDAKQLATDQCRSEDALDVSAASAYGDVQVQAVYPPDQESWNRGDRFWSCFVTRSGGGTMTGSLAPSA
ncbi:septum formation family protein [Curtobacterium sp. MCLR17_007]|uniref:septum formation family protein n=1 Tax=Curtobacterium sp. MCLR17_007 TaxID=2175648 RepID=UPI000DA8D849|nr:septum formation family protein [Curtobacterium sp. MCLR17_007]WIB60731.1 septum formation family protein [Curtobacterium sp. MCLR17_007]